ncbi:hypothetical protein [Flagellimonas sp. SN16]|uniref:hypothetical protein n=1 Tax=Flagellimonas sp. SN16 TaxID=3415142 RepID=UPI003C3B1097
MKVYENYNQVTMMVWEMNPRKRNENNVIKVNSKVEINVGDVILGDLKMDIQFSEFTIEKIIESRPSSLKGYTYYTLQTAFKYASAQKYIGKLSSRTESRVEGMLRAKEEEESKKKKQYHAAS